MERQRQEYSVLMSVYAGDDPSFFIDAVDSMLSQTVIPDELVMVIDGPVGVELAAAIDEVEANAKVRLPHVVILHLENNLGAGGALMKGAPLCSNELIAIMDADDLSRSNRMERQLVLFRENQGLGLVGSWVSEFVDDDPSHAISIVELPSEHADIVRFSKKRDPFRKPSVIVRKQALIDSGGFTDHTPYYEDWDLFNRIIAAGYQAFNIPEVLVDVRTSEDFFARRGGVLYLKNTLTFIKEQLKTGYFNLFDAAVAFIPHAAVILLPTSVRGWIYKTFLRRAVSNE